MSNAKLNTGAEDVTTYIANCPVSVQEVLEKLRTTILKAAPEAEETISYKMPAYKYYGMLVYFAAYQNHIGFYATPTGHKEFEKELAPYKQGKGSVQFPLNQPLPFALIAKIVKYRAQENLANFQKKEKAKQ
ncbi:iron chaperone [Arenibacter palladensis]|uniref:iron chaperone n=1 Tax=Arenibacter palladensis TaxID=237373 RepID=UPI0026E2A42F|nr:DUF1801 domain-containing protein [Arenibacter palladensis]MDO6602017.1 DUF1801 domain-containing protein [Arenibacter palladensis]|tara:strand:- start:5049 stop:5444 length:396 start_codon:yes stop_codon:yes gene_type:complete